MICTPYAWLVENSYMCLPDVFWSWLGDILRILAAGLPVIVGAFLAYRFALRKEFTTFKRTHLLKACEEFSAASLKMTETLHIIDIYANVFKSERPTLQDVCSLCIDHKRLPEGFGSDPTDRIAMIQGTLALLNLEPIVFELKRLGDLFEQQFHSMTEAVNSKSLQETREAIFQKRIQIIRMMRKEFH